jgi:hypothetical protein
VVKSLYTLAYCNRLCQSERMARHKKIWGASLKYGGKDSQLMEGDLFRMVISVPEFGEKPTGTIPAHQGEAHDEAHDLTEIEKSIITACAKEAYSTPELLIIPAKPTSRLQKYRLTDKPTAREAGINEGVTFFRNAMIHLNCMR